MSRDRAAPISCPAVVVQPASRLAAARDLAVIALCVVLLAAIFLGWGEPAEPAGRTPGTESSLRL